jgi:hypothetical protein
MNTTAPHTLLAATYNCGVYGRGTYEQCATTSTGQTGGLAYTGYNVIIPVALGLAIILASGILLVKQLVRRRRSHAQ